MINQASDTFLAISSIRDSMPVPPQRHTPDIPELDCAIIQARDNSLAVRGESYGPGSVLMPSERTDHTHTFLDIPYPDRVV
jgi:hypothetical protein